MLQDEEEEEEENVETFDGIFNAHLLEDDYLDQQSYNGSMSDGSTNSSKARKQQKKEMMDEDKVQQDIRKHLNIDFDENDSDLNLRKQSMDDINNLGGLGSELEQFDDNARNEVISQEVYQEDIKVDSFIE